MKKGLVAMQFRVGLLQMTACGNDQEANLAKGEQYCRRAKEMGADIALFPEMWNIGYTSYVPRKLDVCDIWQAAELWDEEGLIFQERWREAREQWQAQAISQDSPFIMHFRSLARELQMAIALTYLEQWEGAPRNTVAVIDRHGEIVLTYAKVHTCIFGAMESACTPGDDFFVCTLDTAQGEVKIGAMICFDREFPESARVLMVKGAEVILVPNACELEGNRLAQFRTRAFENMVGMAMTNYAAPQENGHSVAFEPMAFDKDGGRDTLLVETGENEGVYIANFDVEKIREWRAREVWGNAFRRPQCYGVLTDTKVEKPFRRFSKDGRQYGVE